LYISFQGKLKSFRSGNTKLLELNGFLFGRVTFSRVEKIIDHPQYRGSDQNYDYDFSLLQLVRKLNFGRTRAPISLPESSDIINENSTLLVSGWGVNTIEDNTFGPPLRAAVVYIVNQEKCNLAYEGKLTPRMICAAAPGINSCHG
jgi:kallikrein 8